MVDIRNSLLNLCPPLSACGILPSRIQIWERCGMSELVKTNASNFRHLNNPWSTIVSHQTIITRPLDTEIEIQDSPGLRSVSLKASDKSLCLPVIYSFDAHLRDKWSKSAELKVWQVRFRCNRAANWAQRLFSSALPPCPTCSITSVAAPQKPWEVKLTVSPSPIWSHHRTMTFRTSNDHGNG